MPTPVGYTKSWRKELESDVWNMPPLYHRVWRYLINSVSWEPNIFPTCRMFGINLNPGQQLFSIQQIVDGVSWKERNVTKKPNKKTILHILKWLEFQDMIVRESNDNGTFISICNWDKYQSKKTPEVTEGIPQGTPESTHTKEVKEVKEEENIVVQEPRQQIPYSDIIDFLNKTIGKNYKASTKSTRSFIKARWNEGFVYEDFVTVIKTMHKKWGCDPNMECFLRPQTLFGTKFESYLQSSEDVKNAGQNCDECDYRHRGACKVDKVGCKSFKRV